MTVEEFVPTHLLSTTQSTDATPSKSVIGTMADHADLLDEVVADAHAARERDRLRIESDG